MCVLSCMHSLVESTSTYVSTRLFESNLYCNSIVYPIFQYGTTMVKISFLSSLWFVLDVLIYGYNGKAKAKSLSMLVVSSGGWSRTRLLIQTNS